MLLRMWQNVFTVLSHNHVYIIAKYRLSVCFLRSIYSLRLFQLTCRWRLLLPLRRILLFFFLALFLLLMIHYTSEQVSYILHHRLYNMTLTEGIPVAPIKSWNLSSHPQCINRTISMGMALSFRYKQSYVLHDNLMPLDRSPYFTDLLPTFCSTASSYYCYTFYIAYDYNDPVLSLAVGQFTFLNIFRRVASKTNCLENLKVNMKFVYCNYTDRPARSQNDAMMAGYKDNMEYYYMVNDDTTFDTPDWAHVLTQTLRQMSPPNVGTTGPTQEGGNLNVMTYNFAHRTHIDIFGYFYPPEFTTWSADSWIDGVYRPHNSYKHPDVHVTHRQERGTRYGHAKSYPQHLYIEVMRHTRQILRRYVNAHYPGVCWFYYHDVDIKQLY